MSLAKDISLDEARELVSAWNEDLSVQVYREGDEIVIVGHRDDDEWNIWGCNFKMRLRNYEGVGELYIPFMDFDHPRIGQGTSILDHLLPHRERYGVERLVTDRSREAAIQWMTSLGAVERGDNELVLDLSIIPLPE